LSVCNSGFSFEAFVGPLDELEERGWNSANSEICTTTTPEGARAFASEVLVVAGLAKRGPRR
jgi:hypothetical protein